MASKRVVCKECGEVQDITRDDVQVERLPINIPFTTSFRHYYTCKCCKKENGLWPDEVPKN